MPFESLSFRHTVHLPDVPHRWLPLIYLYDPDLPLFPLYYFHVLRNDLPTQTRPRLTDRAFGYVEHVRLAEQGIDVGLVLNKDLEGNANFKTPVEEEIRERFGVANPVTLADIGNVFQPPLDAANTLLVELWHRVVADAYGDCLPFGRLWDPVLGLARFVSSFNAPGGRKSEIIQTHYFSKSFGVPVHSAAGIPQNEFHLFPTISELCDSENPLNDFPRFRDLTNVARAIVQGHGRTVTIANISISGFTNPGRGSLNYQRLFQIFQSVLSSPLQRVAIDCFNAFDKGPPRTILFLLMLHDLRNGVLRPETFDSETCGAIYDDLKRVSTYQSGKVIQLYAQQCFGNIHAMPADVWVNIFLRWPLKVFPETRTRNPFSQIFRHATGLGKMERLVWVTAQARKVHSSAADDVVWCIKKGARGIKRNKPWQLSRGANPFACNICLDAVRNVCPAYAAIRGETVGFNTSNARAAFNISTSSANNSTHNQQFVRCSGQSIYTPIIDEFSPDDDSEGFTPFPAPLRFHRNQMTVDEFVNTY